ncbi:NADPH-dependent diflavin oxidoreductase 1 [Chionoecetes opilio]|uniref:NADPH-dependent diflavin oxidoreductase 1 n=1 Tax=Chionoecetes opilio TaxID=41210 RepID=A0A8J4YDD9_CHIOP|nr:NADPH-dependent diflavin oxidoreductase 1 [Chionoecetes opilio]
MEAPVSRSRLEINFMRLLDETQQMANGSKAKDWTFEKWVEGRRMTVLYGSQTGTAQELAERIGREARRHSFVPTVLAMDDCTLDRLTKETLTVFVAATTGQGDDPDNMRNFFSVLWSQRRNRHLLSHLKFGVLGLGDSSYQKFNYSAKRLNNLLGYLGGQPLLKIGLGDDQHDLGPEFVIDPWLENWWNKVLDFYPLPEGVKPLSSKIMLPPKYKLKVITDNQVNQSNCDKRTDNSEHKGEACASNPCLAEVTGNRRVTADDHFQEVRLIEFDTSQIKTKHKPGDVLIIQPQNLEEHVEEFITVLGLDPNLKFSLELNDPNATLPLDSVLPTPCTVRECVQKYFDIQAVPKRYFFELLSYFTKDEMEKEKFEEFTTAEGQQALHDYCTRPKRSITEVLADFPHTRQNIPIDYLFDLMPSIKPRPYSIASSSLAMPNRTQLLLPSSATTQYSAGQGWVCAPTGSLGRR